MRKTILFTLTLIVLCVSGTNATQRIPLFEYFTNSEDPICRGANNYLDQLILDYNEEVCIIRYHVWWPSSNDPFYQYNQTDNRYRNNYYDNNYIPHSYIDGIIDATYQYTQWESLYLDRLSESSPLEIGSTCYYDSETRDGSIHTIVKATDQIDFNKLVYHCVLIENNAEYDTMTYNQVMRDMIYNFFGEYFTINYGETIVFERNFHLDAIINEDQAEMVTFAQDSLTKEIHQSSRINITNAPDITIGMVPDQAPLVVPAGSNFTYEGILTNNSEVFASTNVWIKVRIPDGPIYEQSINSWEYLIIETNQTNNYYPVHQHIPMNARLGTYQYIAYCGDYPIICDSVYFPVTVTAASLRSHNNSLSWEVNGWGENRTTPKMKLDNYTIINNFPNPFNTSTEISYTLTEQSNVQLNIYNILGQKIITLVAEKQQAGIHTTIWDASEYSSGLYFYKLTTGEKTITKRMTLLK